MPLDTLGLFLFATGTLLFGLGIVLPLLPMGSWGESFPRRDRSRPATVDVIVPAYLEASVVVSKIRATKAALARCGIAGKIIVVASDSETAAAAAEADIVIATGRDGKPQAITYGVTASTADVCVSTDANCHIGPEDWPSQLLDSMDANDLVSVEKRERGGSEQAFWLLERLYKRPGRTSETLAVAGEFMAFRRTDYTPIPAGTLCDDLWQALDFQSRGLKVSLAGGIFTSEPDALAPAQWGRSIRIAQGLFLEALPLAKQLLKTPVGRTFLAHKVYRVTVGCLGFWLAVTGVLLVLPWWCAVLVAVALMILGSIYAGRTDVTMGLAPAASVVGLQAVPPVAGWKALRRALRRSRPREAGWPKIAR